MTQLSGNLLRVYKCTFMSTSFLMPDGKPCIFVNGVYRTSVPREILEFDNMIASGHPHFYIDPNEREVDATLVDPMAALRYRLEEEFKQKYNIAAGNPDRDMGNSDQTMKLNVASTRNIEDAAAGGSGVSVAARLMAMKVAPPVSTGVINTATGTVIETAPVVSPNP